MLGLITGKIGAAGNLTQVVDDDGLVILRPAKIAEVGYLTIVPEHGMSSGVSDAISRGADDLTEVVVAVGDSVGVAGVQGKRVDLAILPNRRQSLLDLVKRRLSADHRPGSLDPG